MSLTNYSLLLISFLSMLNELSAQSPGNYELVWSDEFNTDGPPDSSKWNYEKGFVRNEELQWYQPINASCHDGLLNIEARKEKLSNPVYSNSARDWRKSRPEIQYTSSCLVTSGKATWQYGRFEMRARIDIAEGLWPAWWTLGTEKKWPANGEIDIMEYYRDQLLANILCEGINGRQEWHSTRQSVKKMGGVEWAAKFHIWKMDWTDTTVALYVDDQLLNKMQVDSLVNKDGSGFNPFRQPHYMLLNLAIGGLNGGDPGKTTFPRRFEVDYVRVYQEKTN